MLVKTGSAPLAPGRGTIDMDRIAFFMLLGLIIYVSVAGGA